MKCSRCHHENPSSRETCERCNLPLIDVEEETILESRPSSGQASQTAGSPGDVPTEYLPAAGAQESASSVSSPSQGSGSYPRSSTGQLLQNAVFAGRYQILDVLGEGGMGVVYKAMDLELNKLIALKTIRSERETDSEIVQRFKRELLLAREITHKNVVRIHDFGESEDIKYFTMAFIEGQSLKALIRHEKRIPADRAVAIIRPILSALQEAHDQGVIHRDLKPQNIMIDENGVPMIMDFGIARSAGVDTTDLTATGMMIGTPDYMSPEQVKGEKATAQSDLFSFGVILYEMLTGDLPYKADSPASKVMMRLSHKPRAPRQISIDIPKYLEQIIQKCMEVDTAFRYKSADEVIEDIDRQLVDRSLTLKVQKAVGRSKAKIAAGVAAVLAVAALTYLAVRPSGSPAETAPGETVAARSLAILPFTNATGQEDNEWMRNGIPEMLVSDIGQSNYVRPVPSERVLKVMRELGVAGNTRFDEPTLDSIAERVPADSLLYGQFVESGGNLRLDLTVRQTGSGVPTPVNAEMASDDVFAIVDTLTEGVKAQLDLSEDEIRGDVDRPVSEVATGSFEALRSYQRGLDQLNEGNNQDAARLLEAATQTDPNFAMAYAKYAEAQFALGEYVEAEAAIDRAQRLAQDGPLPVAQRYQIHATAALVRDQYETAAEAFAELANLYPSDPDIHLSLARAYEELAHMPEAKAAYEDVVRLAPDYGAALLGLGRIMVMGGDPEGSVEMLERALETGQFDEDPEALGMIHSIMGVAHREMGDLDSALTNLQLSLEARTESGNQGGRATTLINMAAVYEFRGDLDKSLEALHQAIEIGREMEDTSQESFGLNNLGLTLKMAGRLDESLEAFRDSLRLEMDRQDYGEMANRLDHIADIYQLQGQYDDAIIYLERAQGYLEQTEDQLETSINLAHIGTVRRAQGLYHQAIDAYTKGIAISHEINNYIGVSTMQQRLADIYIKQGRYADAYASLEEALEIANRLNMEHDIAEVKSPLGHLQIEVGRLEEAEATLGEAEHVAHGAEAEGLLPDVYLGRARLLALKGRDDEAAEAYEEANVRANLSGQKEVAVASRVELGKLFLRQGKIPNAQRMLERTRSEAEDSRLRPLESAAAAAVADVYLAQGDAEKARRAALEAINIADKFDGRPMLVDAYASLGRALEELGRTEESIDAFARSAETLEWIRGSLRPEHVASYIARPDIHEVVTSTAAELESGGRADQAATLKSWLDSED